MREDTMRRVEEEKVIAIVRGVEPEKCLRVAEALYAGGIRLMEVTFNLKDPDSYQLTANSINEIVKTYGDRMLAGAGTVVSPELVELAASAGALYIISPDCNVDVIHKTRELGLVSMPGAMTPTEILTAHREGADYVKLFPAANLGPSYIKAVTAPISNVKIMVVGGINEDNVADYLKVGAVGAGVGGNLVNKKYIDAGEYDKLTEVAKKLVAAAHSV